MKYYLNSSWHEIDENIDYSQGVQSTSRIDDVFETCTFKAYLSNALPIPPYTLFKDGSTQWVGKSKVTQYLTESGLYVHEFELLEPSAFLKCFIIGVKVYSKESPTWGADSEKVKSLLRQAKRMYPDYDFDFGNSINNKILTSKTYTFGATDTLYDCLNQICQENDVKLKVEFEDDDPTQIKVKVNEVVSGFYDLSDSRLRITNHTKDQDAENYGRYLETYASNVVDRDNITYCSFLETKADDALLNADTCKLKMPTAIESVVDFGIIQSYSNSGISYASIFVTNLKEYFPDWFTYPGQGNIQVRSYYGDLSEITCQIGGQTVYFFDYLYENHFKKRFPFVSKSIFFDTVFIAQDLPTTNNGQLTLYAYNNCKGKISKMSGLLEKSVWDTLTPQQQAQRCFYTIGGNSIENMNGKYKNDLWNSLIGQSRGNFLEYARSSSESFLELNIEYSLDLAASSGDVANFVYYVDYYAITNPYIRDTKDETPLNESNFKPISRSYGVSANYIDFDKLTPNMHTSNNTLGQIERTYEIDLTDFNIVGLDNPKAGNAVRLTPNSTTYWYISSCIRTRKFYGGKDVALLTVVRNYSKKAESIGVDSQEESTNNPLHGITTRPIYLEHLTTDVIDDIKNRSWYMRFTFYGTNGNLIHNTNYDNTDVTSLYSRCSVQAYQKEMLCYCEMLDQIIFEFGRGTQQTGYYEQIPFLYTNENAECGFVVVTLGTMGQSVDSEFLLPVGTNADFTAHYQMPMQRIDKDAREKLTFSLKIRHVDSL